MFENDAMLLSYVNTKLRDEYDDFQSLCEDLQWNKEEVEGRLNAAGWNYNPEQNKFA